MRRRSKPTSGTTLDLYSASVKVPKSQLHVQFRNVER
jgi:hypothetical protein